MYPQGQRCRRLHRHYADARRRPWPTGEYFESLLTSAVMTEAEKAFDENNYQKALAYT